MKNRLKNRIWSKLCKCFVGSGNNKYYINQKGNIIIVDKNGFLHETLENNYIINQFTGIKDKNGKEIYEGDIVICKYGPQIAMEVKWVDEGFRTLGKYNGDNYVGYVKNSAEVIGNIYENPELLNLLEE